MGSESNGARGCLSTMATLVAIGAGLVSIIGYFYPNSETFLESFSQIFENILPALGAFLSDLEITLREYVESHPSSTWISAVSVILLAGLVSFWIEVDVLFDSPVQTLLAVSPLAFLWIWLFSSFASGLGLALFVIGFLFAVFIFAVLDI